MRKLWPIALPSAPCPEKSPFFLQKMALLSLRFPKEHAILKEQGYITPNPFNNRDLGENHERTI